MPLQATSGAASYDAFGGGVPVVPAYIEEVFSTFVFTGTGSNLTIQNEIDLSTKGGLAWMKGRVSPNAPDHHLFDTARGFTKNLTTNSTAAQNDYTTNGPTALTNGFSIPGSGGGELNRVGDTYVSWTFRKQPKFFDVVTWTGDGTSYRDIAHSLNAVPACMIVKVTSTTGDWFVYHKNLASDQYYLKLNTTAAQSSASSPFDLPPTSTVFTVGYNGVNSLNTTGATYVAYLFAHDAGGFGLTGTDNVISCGSFTADVNGNVSVTLGYEPQWVMVKRTSGVGDWLMFDTMRGMPTAAASGVFSATLLAQSSVAEDAAGGTIGVNATGFNSLNGYLASSNAYIYIAIRRGPMKVPTVGTSVFNNIARTGTGVAATITGVGFAPDLVLGADRTGANTGGDSRYYWVDKLRGRSQYLSSPVTAGEVGPSSATQDVTAFGMDGISVGTTANAYFNVIADPLIHHYFKRAPSFFDEVCYTGNGTTLTVSHNLGVAPQLMIVKARSIASQNWFTYSETLGNNYALRLDQNYGIDVLGTFPYWNNTTPTSTNFVVNNSGNPQVTNGSGVTYVAYLFATCAGVSKVTSFTGNGSSQTINCGFTAGSRFVMIKRTDSTGDWYVWDSARGIVSGNDPHLSLNSTAAEVTTDDTIDTDSTGFIVNQVSATNSNVNGASYIVLAIA
jgi:hypothetical protein